jgi:predicted esterase
MIRKLARIAGLIAAIPASILIALAFITPITPSGALYLFGLTVVVVGTISAPWRQTRRRGLVRAGLILLLVTAGARLLSPINNSVVKVIILPEGIRTSWLNDLFDEQDVTLFAERLLSLFGAISPDEDQNLLPAMQAAFAAMRDESGQTSSPFIRTYLRLQRPDSFDLVIVEPDAAQIPDVGVIFLHGYTGNFTMPCWVFAQDFRTINAVTVCPSVGWRGDWWTPDGEATVRTTLTYLHERGVNRIYLAGLSNGAVGASEMAGRIASDLAGLILISGISSDPADSGLPTLLIQGAHDTRMPADIMRAYAGDDATYIELDSDHFMMLKQADAVYDSINTWLEHQEITNS